MENYLHKCLDSVIGQTLSDIEIICVNDGSTDSSAAILEEYAQKDSRIKIISKENGGLSSARNEGLKHATAGFVGFVDSDDWIEPETYELALTKMADDIDFVCWGANIINDGLEEDSKSVSVGKSYHKLKLKGKVRLTDTNILKSTVTAWNKLYRKSIIEKFNILFPEGLLYEDNDFFYKYATQSGFGYYLDKYLYNYVQRPNSIMERIYNSQSTKITDSLAIFKNIYEYYEQHNILDKHVLLLTKLIRRYLSSDYQYCPNDKKHLVLEYASEIAQNFNPDFFEDNTVFYLKNKEYEKIDILNNSSKLKLNIFGIKLSLNYQKIFFIKKSISYDIIRILGIKIKINKKDA